MTARLAVLLFGAACFGGCTDRAHEAAPTSANDPARAAPGGTQVEETPPSFTNVARQAGIDFVHHNGKSTELYLPEIMAGGGGFLDYDGDGWQDLFLVQTGVFGELNPERTSHLYRNRRDGTFEKAASAAGADITGYGMGCAAADFDNDGDVDLFVTRIGSNVLLRNLGNGAFEDISRAAGFGDPTGYSSSAAWFDYDQDGLLDLYVCRYLHWNLELNKHCRNTAKQIADYCNPTAYEKATDLLYHNQGNGVFRDVSREAGILQVPGYSLAVVCFDFDGDHRIDVFVATDQSGCKLWRNLGDGKFRDEASSIGCRLNGEGGKIAGMGICYADCDDDLDFDLIVTNLRPSAALMLRREGNYYQDYSARWGENSWLRKGTGFGIAAVDENLDGVLELFIANGAVNAEGEPVRVDAPYAELNFFLRRSAGGGYHRVPLPAEIAPASVSRAVACADYDRDGDVDLLVCRNDDTPYLLRNDRANASHWLTIEVVDERSGSAILQSRVTVRAGGQSWVREITPQQSYLATSEPVAHFGVAGHSEVDEVLIEVPDGRRSKLEQQRSDQRIKVAFPRR